MSLFPPDEVTFYRLVEQTFLLLRGSGLMLSASDAARVRSWEGAGAPARVVCEAIERSFEAHRRAHGESAAPPRSLAYCEAAVQEAIAVWREGEVG